MSDCLQVCHSGQPPFLTDCISFVYGPGDVAVESDDGSISESPENNLHHDVVSSLRQTGYYQHQTLDITIDNGTVSVEGACRGRDDLADLRKD